MTTYLLRWGAVIFVVIVVALVVRQFIQPRSGQTATAYQFMQQRSIPNTTPSPIDTFATCIKKSGATFYGAFWCPHCQAQKALFGSSVHLLPYVECSEPDGTTQTPICIDKKITGYPTWIFADGSELTGEQSFADLAAKTGCAVPK